MRNDDELDPRDEEAVSRWAEALCCSREVLLEAVTCAGPRAGDIKRFLLQSLLRSACAQRRSDQ